jgi:hypothetical protein
MSIRNKRNYKLVFGSGSDAIVVTPPFNITFDGIKSLSGKAANTLDVEIFNLNRQHRESLVKDVDVNVTRYIPIELSVGYGDKLNVIYKGSVLRGFNKRNGPDHITRLECLDGGLDLTQSFTSRAIVDNKNAVKMCLLDMPNTTEGKIKARPDLIRPRVLVGPTGEILDKLAGDDNFFIDNEQVYMLGSDQVVTTNAARVNPSTGLLDTPERDQGIITIETMLNPSIRLGGLVELESTTAPHLDGLYKVDTIGYKGEYDGSDWRQTVSGILAYDYEMIL